MGIGNNGSIEPYQAHEDVCMLKVCTAKRILLTMLKILSVYALAASCVRCGPRQNLRVLTQTMARVPPKSCRTSPCRTPSCRQWVAASIQQERQGGFHICSEKESQAMAVSSSLHPGKSLSLSDLKVSLHPRYGWVVQKSEFSIIKKYNLESIWRLRETSS